MYSRAFAAGLLFCAAFLNNSGLHAQTADTVLVVANANNSNSLALADYYISKRGIPAGNKFTVNWTADDNADGCTLAEFNTLIAGPINAKIATLPRIDYIVLCRNLPYKIIDISQSVDSALAGRTTTKTPNAYFNANARFSSAQFGIYLVARLDGRSWSDSRALVDRGQSSSSGAPIALDVDPMRDGTTYQVYNDEMRAAQNLLSAAGIPTLFESTADFTDFGQKPLGGYDSWGSNDNNYSPATFADLKFAPGAIAETAVSTGADHLRYDGGTQSQISTLVSNGVTGAKGYTYEPFLMAIADPGILFMRYTGGYNLAESYYLASHFVGWQDVVVGDPLCNPYRNSVGVAFSQSSGGTAFFSLTRTGNPNAPLTVYYTSSATGASGSITVPAGQSSGQISVTVPLSNVSQTISVTVSPDSNYIVSDANQSQATLPPIFLSDPTAVPNPASVTQNVQFTAMTGLSGAVWSWDFGDGITATDNGQVTAVSHVYTVAGTYHVTALVSDNNGNAQSSGFDVRIQSAPEGAQPLSVTRLDCRLHYDSNEHDILSITGSIPIHPDRPYPAGTLFSLDIGGILFSAKVNTRGRASVGDGALALIPKVDRRTDANSATMFRASFRSGSWSRTLMAVGIDPDQDASGIKIQIPVTVNFNGQIFSALVWIRYTGSAGKHGSLTVLK
jgi:uncharacterized protein (TIGR03790 family)